MWAKSSMIEIKPALFWTSCLSPVSCYCCWVWPIIFFLSVSVSSVCVWLSSVVGAFSALLLLVSHWLILRIWDITFPLGLVGFRLADWLTGSDLTRECSISHAGYLTSSCCVYHHLCFWADVHVHFCVVHLKPSEENLLQENICLCM